MDWRSIRVRRKGDAPWMHGKLFAFMDIGGAAGLVVGPLLFTWIK